MQQRTRKTLQGQGGFAMILVLCLGALFLALSAAMIYAAGVLTANANRQLQEQEIYERAASFSKVLEEELLSESGGSFADFVGKKYVTGAFYCNSEHKFEDESDGLTITLKKSADESEANLTVSDKGAATYTPKTLEYENNVDTLKTLLGNTYINDYIIDVSVTAKSENESYTYTQSYCHRGVYYVTYTFSNSDGSKVDDYSYTYDKNAEQFTHLNNTLTPSTVVENGYTVTMRIDMTNEPTEYSFTLN